MSQSIQHVPVIIVGGGPTGLAAAGFLAEFGIPSVVLNKRTATSRHPKARGVNARTMELLRQLGCDQFLRNASEDPSRIKTFAICDKIVGGNIQMMPFDAADMGAIDHTPCPGVLTSQDVFEEILYRNVLLRPKVDLRFGHTATKFDQDDGQVSVSVSGLDGNYRITSDYLIAADGANSFVRELLGLRLEGGEPITENVNFLFRSEQLRKILDPLQIAFSVSQLADRMVILSGRPTGRCDHEWTFNVQMKACDKVEDFDTRRLESMISDTVGKTLSDIDPQATMHWSASSKVISDFRLNRVFFVGDAAHLMPPAGALGMNTGIQDSHNLAWKLAYVLLEHASKTLLDSYNQERHPVCAEIVSAATRNLHLLSSKKGREQMWSGSQIGIVLGNAYKSGAFVSDQSERLVPENPYSMLIPDARPGQRAPHVPMRGKSGQSILDLFGRGFVLITGHEAQNWRRASKPFVELSLITVAELDADLEFENAARKQFLERYRIAGNGAVLVRPDGIVAMRWSSEPRKPDEAIASAMKEILGVEFNFNFIH